jgi:hypothetical protein
MLLRQMTTILFLDRNHIIISIQGLIDDEYDTTYCTVLYMKELKTPKCLGSVV